MVIDIGTGAGSAVVRRAAREPKTLFIALDADASAMSDASRRATRPANRGGHPNLIFLGCVAETLPGALREIADEATVVLPWGSLLAAVLEPASATFESIAAVLKPCGTLTILVSAQERDQLTTELDAHAAASLEAQYGAAGYDVVERRPATRADVDALSSGWGRRLGIPERRSAWIFAVRLSGGQAQRSTAG